MDKLLTGRHILVVEDEMLVLMMAEDCLADMGCEHVSVAATVAQALTQIGSNHFDAAMLDINLDGDRSDAIADELAAEGVPFMFATGYGKPGIRDQDQHRPVLTKPYQLSDMEALFERLLPRGETLPLPAE